MKLVVVVGGLWRSFTSAYSCGYSFKRSTGAVSLNLQEMLRPFLILATRYARVGWGKLSPKAQQRTKTSAKIGIGGIGVLAGIDTFDATGQTPLTGRYRVIYTTPEFDAACACETSSRMFDPETLLPTNHATHKRLQRILDSILDAYEKEIGNVLDNTESSRVMKVAKWKLRVVNTPDLNACSLADGSIFFNVGLVDALERMVISKRPGHSMEELDQVLMGLNSKISAGQPRTTQASPVTSFALPTAQTPPENHLVPGAIANAAIEATVPRHKSSWSGALGSFVPSWLTDFILPASASHRNGVRLTHAEAFHVDSQIAFIMSHEVSHVLLRHQVSFIRVPANPYSKPNPNPSLSPSHFYKTRQWLSSSFFCSNHVYLTLDDCRARE
jgi:hypothetical protein